MNHPLTLVRANMTQAKIEEQKRRNEEELERARLKEQERQYAWQLASISPEAQVETEEKKVEFEQDWQKILAAYQKEFPDRKLEERKGGSPVLRFDSEEEAHQFFEKMAKEKHSFAVFEITADGKPTGNVKLSFGDGTLHEAKLAPEKVNDFRKAYADWRQAQEPEKKAALKEQLTNMLKPSLDARNMRDAVKNMKKEEPAPPSTAPNPFKDKMNPY